MMVDESGQTIGVYLILLGGSGWRIYDWRPEERDEFGRSEGCGIKLRDLNV
jgi:hypothetical protein